MSTVLALLPSALALARVRRAIDADTSAAGRRSLLVVKDRQDLEHRIRQQAGDAILVVDPWALGIADIADVGRLLARFGAVVVVYADFSCRAATDTITLYQEGFRHFVSLGIDDASNAIARAIAAA